MPDQYSLNIKKLRGSFVGYSISKCMQPVYQATNPFNLSWKLIDVVHVPVWCNSLQLTTQKEISHLQERNTA